MSDPLVRSATPADYPAIRAIIAAAFKDDEAALWDYLVANDPAMTPDMIRLAVGPDGAPAACTVILPRRIMGPVGQVDGAIITLVACRPDLQGQGYGGATVEDALRYAAGQGLCMAILYGHDGYYPRFGYVPVLDALGTVLPAAAPQAEPEAPALRPATSADVGRMTALYARSLGQYPCAVAREPEPWIWQVRPGRHSQVLMLDGAASAYALVTEQPQQERLYVGEGEASDETAASLLLTALRREAGRRGLKELRLGMPADHLLTRAAMVRDAEQQYRPARYGMVAVTHWEPLLPAGFTAGPEGLRYQEQLILAAAGADLVRLAFGYRTARDLLLAGVARLAGVEGGLGLLDRAFPRRSPRWSLAPYWQ